MICFPLDNTPYEAKDMGTYLATRTRGVFSAESNLTVTPGENGLSVSVSPGLAWLKWSDYWGTAALQEQALTLALDTADGALKRIDAIVCRLDKVNNRAEIVVKKGAPSSAPIVVPPVRDANYDELYIATVLIGAGVISISASAITDQRLNEEYCGLMRDGVTGIPTASLHAQAQQILTELTDALNAQIVRQSAEFDAWFDDLKGKLGEDPATALQLQVDNLNAAVVGDAFQASGAPVSIAYAGANRIASITAYGENAQGGTTEAPVALTGITSVTVNDDVTELPIPRPLHKVGDVRDVCQTRVKSVYDKRIVLDGSEDWKKRTDISITGGSCFYPNNFVNDAISNAPVVASAYFVGRVSPTINLWDMRQVGTNVGIQFNAPFAEVSDFTAWLAEHPLTVYYQSTAYDGTNGLDVCLVEYKTGFVKLDGTEDWKISVNKQKELIMSNFVSATTQKKQICSHATFEFNLSGAGFYIYENTLVFGANYTGKQLSLDEFKAYLAAQKVAGTPVQVAYQLAAPEVYATDPVDFDNAAGPLTVMAGGEVEVRMTELVGSRSDVSNNTVAFVEVSQDADISSGEKLSVLFGKIKKRFSVLASTVMLKSVFTQVGNPNLLDNSDFTNPVNQRGVSGTISTAGYFIDRWKLVSGTVQITAEGLVLNGTISQILENAAGTDVTASASAGTASYDNSTKTFTLTATGQTITWAKLEKGSVATPYVPKGYGAELLACQRYYVPIGENTKFFGGIGTAGNVAFVGMILPVQMRVTPSFTSDLNVVLRTVQGEQNIHGPVISKMTENNLAFTVTLNSGTTKSTPCVGYFYNERGLSADL